MRSHSVGPRLRVKPPLGTPIDWSNPITRGLRLFAHPQPFDLPTGSTYPHIYDIVGRRVGVHTGNATANVQDIGPFGWYTTTFTASAGLLNYSGLDTFEFPITGVWVFRKTQSGAGSGWIKHDGTSNRDDGISVLIQNNGSIQLRSTSVPNNADSPSGFVVDNEWTVLIVASDGTSARFGARSLSSETIQLATDTYGGRPGSSALDELRLGTQGATERTTDHVYFGLWSREFDEADMVSILTDPFQLYRVRRTAPAMVPAAPPVGGHPGWQMLQGIGI